MNSLRKMGLKSWYKLIPEFGYITPLKLGAIAFLKLIVPEKLINWTFELKHSVVERYLINQIGIAPLLPIKNNEECGHHKTIWVFWWQGLDGMPPIVRRCYNRLLKTNSCYEVVLLDRNNYHKYVSLPDHIINKIGKEVSMTHLSDIIRSYLLASYGGIWVDATLYFIKTIPEEVFSMEYFSIKDHIVSSMSPARHRWTTFFMEAKKGNIAMHQLYSNLCFFLGGKKTMIDYLLLDYYIDIIYNNNEEFRKSIEEMPYTDSNVHCMKQLFEEYDVKFIQRIKSDNLFIKMSYKGCDESKLLSYNSNYKHLIKND